MLMISSRSFGDTSTYNPRGFIVPPATPAGAPVSTPSSAAAQITATNTTFVPAGTIINSSTGQVVVPVAAGTPLPTAAVDDGTILGLTPVSWLLVGGAAYLAWKFFGHHADKSSKSEAK